MESVLRYIILNLNKNGNHETAKNYSKYMKNVVKFYGIRGIELKPLFRKMYKEKISKLETRKKVSLAYELFQSDYAEEKSIAIAILGENVKRMDKRNIKDFERIIDNYIYDWATCDGLSSKVLCQMIKNDLSIAKLIVGWKDASCLWRQRAACISFVNIARFGGYNKEVITICSTCIKNNERFVQLGVGWVLRELSLANLDLVVSFIKNNYDSFSREALRYAIEKMSFGLQRELLDLKNKH